MADKAVIIGDLVEALEDAIGHLRLPTYAENWKEPIKGIEACYHRAQLAIFAAKSVGV